MKKGFTLVEILIVIVLIGVIMTLVVPKITSSYKSAKKNMFYDNVISIYSSASSTYFFNASKGNKEKTFTNTNNPLKVDVDDEIKYKVTVNEDGEVLEIKVTNNDFYYTKTSDKIKKSEIKKSDIKEGTISLWWVNKNSFFNTPN